MPGRITILLAAVLCAAYSARGELVNVFPNGDFENQKIVYRLIGNVRGFVGYDSENAASGKYSLKVASMANGNVRGYSGQVIQLKQSKAMPLTISYKGMRRGTGKTLAAVDLVVIYDNNQRNYFFRGLELTGDTGGKWIVKKAVFNPARPIKSIEVWPIVNGDACTAWFDDIRIMAENNTGTNGSSEETVIENDVFRMTFGDFGEVFNLVELTNGISGGVFIRKSGKRLPDNIWSIQFRLPDNRIITVDRGRISGITSNKARNRYYFDWNDLPIPETKGKFSVRVTLDLNGNRAQWHIDVKSTEDLFEVHFPSLSGIGKLGKDAFDDYVAIPDKSGLLLQDYSKIGTLRLTYASGCPMQFFAFYDKNGGLYVSTCDSAMLAKNYTLSHLLDNSLALNVSTIPGLCRAYKQPFPFVMQFFSGDWFDAAQIYRRWAIRQRWCEEAGKLVDRKNPVLDSIHAWIKGTALNAEPYAYPIRTTETIDRMTPEERLRHSGRIASERTSKELIGLVSTLGKGTTAVWMTDNWHTGGCIGITPTSPEYQARKGFREMNDMLSRNGIPVVPYVNFGRYDTGLASYPECDMIRNADLSIRTYPAHGIQQGAICHASPSATALWNGLASRIASYGCSGIYLDELSTNGNPVCYAENHKHQAGDSAVKIKAQRANVIELKKAASAFRKDFFTMGEQGSETYIGANDVNIWWKASEGDEDIPLFEAVYHDYAIGMGRVPGKWYGKHMEKGYPDARGNVGLEEFMLNLGKAFVHGLQLGIVRQDLLEYSPEAAKYLSSMIQLRRKLVSHLHYGQLLRSPRLLHPTEKILVKQSFNAFVSVQSNPILCGAFKAQDASTATVFLNVSEKNRKFYYSVSPVDDWELEDGNYELTKITPMGEEILGVVNAEKGKRHTFSFTLDAREPAAVVWRRTRRRATAGFGEETVPVDNVSVNVSVDSTRIKAGDSLFVTAIFRNNTQKVQDASLEWKLPRGWKVICPTETISAQPASEARLLAEIRSNKALESNRQELGVRIRETGREYKIQVELQKPRKEYSVYSASADEIRKMLNCTFDMDEEDQKIVLAPPEKNAYGIIASLKAAGICRHDKQGLHFLFRVKGVKHADAPDTADIWNGCCMQFVFNGKRLNHPYDISLAEAKTVSGTAIWDFHAGKFTKTVKGNWKNHGNSQCYYLFMPWENLCFDAVPVGGKIGFSATYNHNDGRKFAGYLEWTKGVCGGKQPSEYGNLLICK